MGRPSPRPRFTLRTKLAPAEVKEQVTARLRQESKRLAGIAFEHRIEMSIGGDDVRFWSPQLVVDVAPADDGGAVLAARFGPDPWIWALYFLSYGALGLIALFAMIFGLVQLSIGQSPWALLVAPGAAVLAALVYGASFVGQGLGSEQMYFLRATLTESVAGEDAADPPSSA